MKAIKTMIALVVFMSATVASAECKNQSSVGRFASTSSSKATAVHSDTSKTSDSTSANGKK